MQGLEHDIRYGYTSVKRGANGVSHTTEYDLRRYKGSCDMKHEIIEIPVISEAIRRLGAPTSALTRVGGFLYTCGMPPIDLKTGEIVRGDMTTQARACMDALSFTLRHAGSSLDNVFKSLVFITDNDLAAEMNAVYRAYFPGGFPARSCVAIKPWTYFDIEIECIATVG